MPDPGLTPEELEAHEEEVKNHPLTKDAEHQEAQLEDLQKEAAETAEKEKDRESAVEQYAGQPELDYAAQTATAGHNVEPPGELAPPDPAPESVHRPGTDSVETSQNVGSTEPHSVVNQKAQDEAEVSKDDVAPEERQADDEPVVEAEETSDARAGDAVQAGKKNEAKKDAKSKK